jgi:tRNA uridine 5-carboxymethylaminomethyl modification enzyme
VAGINAARSTQGKEPFVIDRSEAYIGVLIDDLTTKGTEEPYRMFTSRSEYRLSLRSDNADLRLTQKGYEAGCVSEQRRQHAHDIKTRLEVALDMLEYTTESPSNWSQWLNIPISMDGAYRSAKKMLEYADVSLDQLCTLFPHLQKIDTDIRHRAEIESKYAFYLKKQQEDIKAFRRDEHLILPNSLDYSQLMELSHEVREKLTRHRPHTLGAASRIEGITPSALLSLFKYVKRR